mgnify:CR=1 FL=1
MREPGAPASGTAAEAESALPALDWGWGVIVNFRRVGDGGSGKLCREAEKKGGRGVGQVNEYVVDVLLACAPGSEEAVAKGKRALPAGDASAAEQLHVIPVPLAHLDAISSIRLKMPPDIKGADARFGVLKVLRHCTTHAPHHMTMPCLTPPLLFLFARCFERCTAAFPMACRSSPPQRR